MNVLYLQYEEAWKVQYKRWEEGECTLHFSPVVDHSRNFKGI